MDNCPSPNGLDHNSEKVMALSGDLNYTRAKSENDCVDVVDAIDIEHCNDQSNIDKDSVNDNKEKSCEPRNVEKSRKVREVMSLPLPRFAFDLPSLRKRISLDDSEKSEDSADRKSNLLVKESIKFEVPKSPNILSEEEDNKVINNHKCECTSDAANSDKSSEQTLPKASETTSGDLCISIKNESTKINTERPPAPSKSISLDFQRQSNDDFMVSVLDDLKLDSGENLEDDTSLEERIRALDEKLSRIQQGSSKISSSGFLQSDINQTGASAVGSLDYREKYKRHRKDHGTSNVLPEQTRTEPSDLAKILLSRSSIFDQDTQRLEMLDKITQNNTESGAFNFNDNSCYYTCASQPDLPVSQNATSNLYSGLKAWASNSSMTLISGLATKSSLNHMNICNASLMATTKGGDAGQKVHPDNPLKMPVPSSFLSGDPRRIARPLEFVSASSKPCVSVISNDDQVSQFSDSCDVVSQMASKSKEAMPPVSILKKQGMSEDNSNILVETSRSDAFLQDHSAKRKSDIPVDAFPKQPGKILMVDGKPETICNKTSQKPNNALAGNSLTKNCNKALSAKTLVKSHNLGQPSKNKNVLNKPIISERKSKLADGGSANITHKKEFEGGSKSGCVADSKAKENMDGDERITPKEKKSVVAKPTFDDPKDDSDKKSKSLMKSNLSTLDTKDSKKDAKSTSNISKNQKVPLKSKSLQEVQPKKIEDLPKDKTHGDKYQPVHKIEKTIVKQKLTVKTANDEGKDLRTLPKSSVMSKDEKKSKVKLGVSTNRAVIQEAMKKCSKPNVTNSASKDKKPEEKREVKALLQELGSNDDIGEQYVSMYDMVKRRSNKEANVSKSKEERTRSLKLLKASTKRCPSRKTSLRLSSNDSDSNADCSNISKLKSRQKRISSSSSDVSSSDFSGEDDKDVIARKSKKKTAGFFRSLPTKRRIFSDSSSDESNQDMSPKPKKFLSDKAKFLKADSKLEINSSPLCVNQNSKNKTTESLSGKDDLLNSTQSSASEDLTCSESKNILLLEKDASSFPYLEKDLDLNDHHPVPLKCEEYAIAKDIKHEGSDQPGECLLEFQERSNDKESSVDTKPTETQTEKLDIRDCFSDDALLEQMDDDSYVTTLPGFEETSFRLSKESKMQNEVSSDSSSGIPVDNIVGSDISKQDSIQKTTLDVCIDKKDASVSNMDSLSNKSCQESEVSEPVFDDVDTDNNTEELDLAIKSLFRDGEELKFDQVSLLLEKKNENILPEITDVVPGNDTCDTTNPSSEHISKGPLKMDCDIPTSDTIKQNVAEDSGSNNEMLNIEKSEAVSEKVVKDSCRENTKPKEFSGHFISTFKPEQSQCVGQTFRCDEPVCHEDVATTEPSTNLVDNPFSDEVIDNSKKRLNDCEDETSLPSKKAKLDIQHKLTKDDDIVSEQLHTNILKESSVQHSVSCPSGHDLALAPAQFLHESIIQSSESFCASSSISALQSNSSNLASQSCPSSESSSFIPSCQSNVERIIEEVAKGNFDRGFEADYYSSQKKLKIKTKDDPSALLQPSHCNSTCVFTTFAATPCQSYPQEHLYSHNVPGSVSQNAMATSVHGGGQNVSIALSPDLPSQSQNITIMTGSGLVQVSNNNIPSFQQLQMYSAGVAAARQLASSQMQQSLTVNPEMLPQHRPLGPQQVRPSVDAAPIIFRPSTQSSATATTGVQQCQMQVQQHIFQQSSANTQSFHQRHSQSTEKMIPSNQNRLQVTDTVGTIAVQQNLLGQPVHSLQYQLRPSSSSAHIQIPSSSNNRQASNSFIQQQDLFNRSLVFRGQMKVEQQAYTIKESLPRQISPKILDTSQQGTVRPSTTSLASSPSVASSSQMLKVANLTVTSSDANEGMQNIPRPVLTKGDCRQQQLYIRPIMAMQQQQPLSSSSCMDQSSIMVGQHRMPFTIKEPRLSSNFSRAEPKTPGNTMQQPSLMLGVVGSAGQPVQNQSVSLDSTTQQPAINLFPGLTSPPVGILGSAVLIPPQQQQLALEKSLLLNASVQQQRMVQPAAVFQYAAPTQHVNLHHISNSSQLEFFVAGNRMVTPIIQALPTDPIINHGQQGQPSQGINLSAHMSQSMIQQTRPNPENLDRGLAILAQKLPVVWQGLLALKNDSAHVQMHYVCGSKNLVQASLPDNVAPLRIAQRMRLEPTQLEQVTKRMNESDFSMLLAVPCGRDPVEIMTQSHNLQTFFIHYLQQKQAAGIVNILQPNSTQTAYVVHIFPPCDFSVSNLSRLPPDVVQNLVEGGYLLIIITTC